MTNDLTAHDLHYQQPRERFETHLYVVERVDSVGNVEHRKEFYTLRDAHMFAKELVECVPDKIARILEDCGCWLRSTHDGRVGAPLFRRFDAIGFNGTD